MRSSFPSLEGRRGIVTGGCGPLGSIITRSLVACGAEVLVVDLPLLTKTHSEPVMESVEFFECDLTQEGAAESIVQELMDRGVRVDFLVNNAALTGTNALEGYICPFEEQSDEAFSQALHLNLAIPFGLARRLAAQLRSHPDAAIVNVGSVYGLVAPDPSLYEGTSMTTPAAYAASKGGLIQLTRYLASILAPEIRVNCVAPGGILRGQASEFIRRYTDRVPLARMATESEVADAVCWLLSRCSSYVTGQVLAVDGGWTAR